MTSPSSATTTVRVDRESVAMGDDVDTHEEFWDYSPTATVDDLLVDIASDLVASVAGDVGWVVHLMNGRQSSVGTLGVLYCAHRPDTFTVCRPARTALLLSSLSAPTGMDVYVAYLPGARPEDVAALRRVRTHLGRRLDRRATRDGASDVPRWRQLAELRGLARSDSERRRDWLRRNVVGGRRLPGAEDFVAESMHLLYGSLCPASLALTADVFGIPHAGHATTLAGWEVTRFFGDSPTAALAMALCAFEWRLTTVNWEHGRNDLAAAYLRQLARWGHTLSSPEEVLARIRDIGDVIGG